MELSEETIYRSAPYAETLGVRFPDLSADRVRAELAIEHRYTTMGGGLHGGAIMSVCDLAAAVLVGAGAPEGAMWTTAESTTYFLRPATGDLVSAVAVPVKRGKNLVYVDVDAFVDDQHCARTSQVVMVSS